MKPLQNSKKEDKVVHTYGGSSYSHDVEEMVVLMMGSTTPEVDAVEIRMGYKIYNDRHEEINNTFIMNAF